ncbi:DUF1987 domain-containing protein [Heliobacterium undosum]|uniref:DUF1987 domain-containing protein n=1 Tax=Heliomicrobium undosum TaxID=121734 RepID=A0A845KYF6_9FIRM|nr:DUF1987 domain-containing protein [Heliomicrobium undosum]MZP28902.1 DUF1987 domain-containing protein [Heliomicrobium undosum]
MEKLLIEKTHSSPHIFFDSDAHVLTIEGESFPENTAKFYAPVFRWLQQYIAELQDEAARMEIDIVYFNSSTSKILLDMFHLLDEAVAKGKNITVHWRCRDENEMAIECGEEFKEDLRNLPFHIITYSDNGES